MCHADISMITMTWEPTSKYPAADFQNVHECTNWDVLYEWQKERSVEMMKPGFLVHPYLGMICSTFSQVLITSANCVSKVYHFPMAYTMVLGLQTPTTPLAKAVKMKTNCYKR